MSFTNLDYAHTYNFRVTAVNGAGVSPPSNLASVRPATTPSAPDWVETCVMGSNGNQWTVEWGTDTGQPSFDGGSPITSYLLTWGGGQAYANSSPYVVTSGSTGTLWVYAVNSVGRSSGRTYGYLGNYTLCPGTESPGQPSEVKAVAVAGGVNLQWNPPASGGTVTHYVIEYKTTGWNDEYVVHTSNWPAANQRSIDITLPVDVPHYLQVTAANQYGTGSGKRTSKVTPYAFPVAPGLGNLGSAYPPFAPGLLTYVNISFVLPYGSDHPIQVSCTSSGDQGAGMSGNGLYNCNPSEKSTSGTGVNWSDLSIDHTYTFSARVEAPSVQQLNGSWYGGEVSAPTATLTWSPMDWYLENPPPTPTLAAPVSQSSDSLTVALPTKPSGFDYFGATFGYAVSTSSESPSSWCNGCIDSNSWDYNGDQWGTSVTSTASLTPGTDYYVRWMIRDMSGVETWSPATTFTTPALAPLVVASTNDSLTVALPTKPSFDYSGTTFGYAISTSSESPSSWCNGCIDSNSWDYNGNQWGTSITSTASLIPGTDYYVRWMIRDTSGVETWLSATNIKTNLCTPNPNFAAPTVDQIEEDVAWFRLPTEPAGFDDCGMSFRYALLLSPDLPSGWCNANPTPVCIDSLAWTWNSTTPWGAHFPILAAGGVAMLTPETTYYIRWHYQIIEEINGYATGPIELWSPATAFTTTAIPPPPTLAAPTVNVVDGWLAVLTIPSKPTGFDNPGEGGPTLGYGFFETTADPPTTCSGCGVYVPCVNCAYGASFVYDLAPWDGTADVQLIHLEPDTTYYVRLMIRGLTGLDTWSPATIFTTPEAGE